MDCFTQSPVSDSISFFSPLLSINSGEIMVLYDGAAYTDYITHPLTERVRGVD